MQGNCGRMMMLLMFVMFSKKQSMKRGRVQKKYGNFLWHLPLSVRPTPSPPSPLLMALISILFSPHFFSFAIESYLGKPSRGKSEVFLNIVQMGGGGQPMFKNYVGNCRVFWRSFNNMKFA